MQPQLTVPMDFRTRKKDGEGTRQGSAGFGPAAAAHLVLKARPLRGMKTVPGGATPNCLE